MAANSLEPVLQVSREFERLKRWQVLEPGMAEMSWMLVSAAGRGSAASAGQETAAGMV